MFDSTWFSVPFWTFLQCLVDPSQGELGHNLCKYNCKPVPVFADFLHISLWRVSGWCKHLKMLQLQHFVWKHFSWWMRSLDNGLIQATRSQTSSGQLNAVECEKDTETKPLASIAKQELGSSRMIKFCLVCRISERRESPCGWGLCCGIPPTGIPAVNIGSIYLRTHGVDEPVCTSPSWHSLKKDFSWYCFNAKCAGVLCHLRHIAATCSGSKDVLGTNKTWALGTCLLLFFCTSLKIRNGTGIEQGMEFVFILQWKPSEDAQNALLSLLRSCCSLICTAWLKTWMYIFFKDRIADAVTLNVSE